MSSRRPSVRPSAHAGPARRLALGLRVGQAVGGAVMVCRPEPVARAVSSAPRNTPASWVLRLLGLRLLVQALVVAVWPRPKLAAVSAAVDATHAATMAAAAVVEPRYRRGAAISGVVSLISATVSARAATSPQGSTP